MADFLKMTYEESTQYIFAQHPVFERSGATAYKPGLRNVLALSEAFGRPERGLRCIHVAGTNGKGTTSHSLAAILQAAGLRTGLYTSPHISDFRERILVDGRMIEKAAVCDFTERYRAMGLKDVHASFFELSTVMAFEHFRREGVDVAVVETGLGGRLDSTNIVSPELCVITNISLDHTDLLGDTPAEIAAEKAGIIKEGVPVAVGEAGAEVRAVFDARAAEMHTAAVYAEDRGDIAVRTDAEGRVEVAESPFGAFGTCLRGDYQRANVRTVVCAADMLRARGMAITDRAVSEGLAAVGRTLRGRWERHEGVLCDCGHNAAAWEYTSRYLARKGSEGACVAVTGFCADKDVDSIIGMLPASVRYHCVAAPTPRAIPAADLAAKMRLRGLHAQAFGSVREGVDAARLTGASEIFLGGSFYVVAEFL